MFDGERDVTVPVPVSGTENVMVPVIRAIVVRDEGPRAILLQRRANPAEAVYRLLEIPGGMWRAGESPIAAISREVREETDVVLTSVSGVSVDDIDDRRSIATLRPLAVIAGIYEAFPAIHVVVVATGTGVPNPSDGESYDVQWWPTEAVRSELQLRPEVFIPSTRAAITAYLASVDTVSG